MKLTSHGNQNFNCSECNTQTELLFTKDLEVQVPFPIITRKNGSISPVSRTIFCIFTF